MRDSNIVNLNEAAGFTGINHLDPEGLFFKKLFIWIGKILKWVSIVVLIVMTSVSSFIFKAAWWLYSNVLLPLSQKPILGAI